MAGIITTASGKKFPLKILTAAEFKKALRPYVTTLGYVAFSWNRLHDNLSHLFKALVKTESADMAQAIWYPADSDIIQRKMLRSAAEMAIHLTTSQRDEIKWLLNQIDDALRHQRNNALHAPLMLMRGVIDDVLLTWVEANKFSASPRAKALRDKNLINEFEAYGAHIDVLSDYAANMSNAIIFPGVHTWPERPDLPHAHQKKKIRRSTRK